MSARMPTVYRNLVQGNVALTGALVSYTRGVGDGVFNTWVQENRPLSLHLCRIGGRLLQGIQRSSVDELTQFEGPALGEVIDRLRQIAPSIGGGRPADTRERQGERQVRPGVYLPTTWHHIALQVTGEADLLRYWPDTNPEALQPVDEAVVASLGGMNAVRTATKRYLPHGRRQRKHGRWVRSTTLVPKEMKSGRFTRISISPSKRRRRLLGER